MHPRRTSKLARETRRKGALRPKRTSTAEEETTKEKESVTTAPAGEVPEKKPESREGVRHTRPRSPAEKAEERPHRRKTGRK